MIKVCAFDAYGTLFDVASAARNLATKNSFEGFKDHWVKVATTWRLKQLQYSWLRAVTGDHKDFWQVTKDALDFALEESGFSDPELRQALLDLYWKLEAYPEAKLVLETLKAKEISTTILSNGSPDMIDAAVQSSQLKDHLDDQLSVESVGVFKPNPRVYQMVCDRFKCDATNVMLISSNGWDIAGGGQFGFQTYWVNRAGEPIDRIEKKPMNIGSDLNDILKVV